MKVRLSTRKDRGGFGWGDWRNGGRRYGIRCGSLYRWGFVIAACYLFVRAALAGEAPARVVSLNPCIDTILVEIAPREQIAALSFRSRDPKSSVIAELASTYPITYETAEEVVVLRPDLVLATKHSALATRNALKRVGVRTVMLDVPESIDASFAQITKVAAVIGRPNEGRALIARLQHSIEAARGQSHITAIIYQPTGFTPGKDTLVSELMRVVGFDNVAERYGIKRWGIVGLEQLVADPPALLLVGETDPGAPTRAEKILQHPALRRLQNNSAQPEMAREIFPAPRLYCGGPVMALALQSLVHARDAVLKTRRNGGI